MTTARRSSRTELPARDAYRLWAPAYDDENAVSFLEDMGVREATPDSAGRPLLDAGCGTARRVRRLEGTHAVGVDLVLEMLAHALAGGIPSHLRLAAADVRALPFVADSFDILWCRLVLGHTRRIDDAYRELGRVARTGASLIVTDFHPRAVAAGHRRTFRDTTGELRVIEHHVHLPSDHADAAARAGWRLVLQRDLRIGTEVRPFYERAGALQRYEADHGLPLVLLLRFER